jgi:hypothetical protein
VVLLLRVCEEMEDKKLQVRAKIIDFDKTVFVVQGSAGLEQR